MENQSLSILVDTDIGSDIDDAVALSYLLRQPRCNLLGITTVTGDVAQRAACADALCRTMGHNDIPIITGARTPLLFGKSQMDVPQYAAIAREKESAYPAGAVEFLKSTIRRHPGEITLLSIGPMTNIALLFALDPQIPSLLKGFVAMAGSFFEPMRTYVPAEYNIRADPVAAAIVYNRSYDSHAPFVTVSIDVTGQCFMKPAEVRDRFQTTPLDIALAMAEVWFSRATTMAFHDPLAASVIFESALCSYASGRVEVSIDSEVPGQTRFVEDVDGPHQVTNAVNPERFFAHFFGAFA